MIDPPLLMKCKKQLLGYNSESIIQENEQTFKKGKMVEPAPLDAHAATLKIKNVKKRFHCDCNTMATHISIMLDLPDTVRMLVRSDEIQF